jgi:hypothetical protein
MLEALWLLHWILFVNLFQENWQKSMNSTQVIISKNYLTVMQSTIYTHDNNFHAL